MYIINIASTIKRMSVNEIRDFTFENYYKQIGLSKKNSNYSMKHHERKIYNCLQLNASNAKEHYQSFIKKKNIKSVIQSKDNYLATKNF